MSFVTKCSTRHCLLYILCNRYIGERVVTTQYHHSECACVITIPLPVDTVPCQLLRFVGKGKKGKES